MELTLMQKRYDELLKWADANKDFEARSAAEEAWDMLGKEFVNVEMRSKFIECASAMYKCGYARAMIDTES